MQVLIQFFKEMSLVRVVGIVVAIIGVIVVSIFFIGKVNDNEYEVLYSELDIQDSAQITEELGKININYIVNHKGTSIKVHKNEVVEARMALAKIGLPNSGSIIGYEIFDEEDGIGSTNFFQNIKLIRALEGELSRTILAFEPVEKVRVHLVMPQKEIFSKEKIEPRASIVLKIRRGKELKRSEIDAISHLIVTSVPNLEMKRVTIVDTMGKALKIGSSEEGGNFLSGKNEEIKSSKERMYKERIEEILSTVGAHNVKAEVSLDMNFDRIVTNSEIYDPESAVARSTQIMEERDQTPLSGGSSFDASAANNLPGGGGGGDSGSGFATTEKTDSTTNYEISKTIRNHISESGIINKMSIGILIDGTYDVNKETSERTYVERSQEDLDKITNLVKRAIGFNEDRGDEIEVINMQFSTELESYFEEDHWLKDELPKLFQTAVFAIVVLLVLIVVIRPIAMKAFEVRKVSEEEQAFIDARDEALQNNALEESENPADEMDPEALARANKITKMNELAANNSEELVSVLRKWINEGGNR